MENAGQQSVESQPLENEEHASYEKNVASLYALYTASPLRMRSSMQTLESLLPAQSAVKITIDNAVEHFMSEQVSNVVKLHALMRSHEGRLTLQRIHDKKFSKEEIEGQEYWAEKAERATSVWTDSALSYLGKLEASVAELNEEYRQKFASEIGYIASLKGMIAREKAGLDSEAGYHVELQDIRKTRQEYLAFRDQADADLEGQRAEIHELEGKLKWTFMPRKRSELKRQIDRKRSEFKVAVMSYQGRSETYQNRLSRRVKAANEKYVPQGKRAISADKVLSLKRAEKAAEKKAA